MGGFKGFQFLDPALLMDEIPKENNLVSLYSEGWWHFVGTLTGIIALVTLVVICVCGRDYAFLKIIR